MNFKQASTLFFFFLLVVVPIGFSSEIQDGSLLPKYLLLASALLGTLLFTLPKRKKISSGIQLSELFLFSYLGFSLISIVGAINSSDAIFEASKIVLFCITYFICKAFLKQDQEKSVQSIVLFSTVALILAISFSFKDLMEALRLKENLRATTYLVKGFHGHKNLLSSWIMLLLPLSALGFAIKPDNKKAFRVISVILALAFISLLQTRAVWLAIITGISVYFMVLFGLKKDKSIVLQSLVYGALIITAAFIVITLISDVPEKLLSSINLGPTSAQERVLLWKKTISLIKQESFWGIGGGNWKTLFPSQGIDGLYRAELNNVIFIRPHNDLLWRWSEFGLLALLSFLGFLFLNLIKAIKGLTQKKEEGKLTAIAVAGLFAYLVLSLLDFPMERIEHQTAFAILLALTSLDNEGKEVMKLNKGVKTFTQTVSAISLIFCLYMGYNRFEAEKHIKKLISYKDTGQNDLLLQEAQKIDRTLIQSDINAVPIIWYEGNAHFNLGNREKAAECYIKALEINPYNFNVVGNAATAYYLQNDLQTAIQYYSKAIQINPKYEDAKLNLTSIYINLQQWENASFWLDQLEAKSLRSEQLHQIILNNQ